MTTVIKIKIHTIVLVVLATAAILNASVLPVEYAPKTYVPGQNFIGELHTYKPSDSDVYDLSHYKYYTWGIDVSDIADDAANINNAELVFRNIKNYNSAANVLYVNILDTANVGLAVGTDNQGGGNYFAQYELIGQWTYVPDYNGQKYDLVFHFDNDLLALLSQYAADGVIGFGFDPDCHFYNDGVTFAVETIPEPATIIILTFGGLMLRRNKK